MKRFSFQKTTELRPAVVSLNIFCSSSVLTFPAVVVTPAAEDSFQATEDLAPNLEHTLQA